VQTVTEIQAEHPEKRCQRCGQLNPCWYAPNALWNTVTGHPAGLVICPQCFQDDADAMGFTVVFKAELIATGVTPTFGIHRQLGCIAQFPVYVTGWMHPAEWLLLDHYPSQEEYFELMKNNIRDEVLRDRNTGT
jgi:hypothetical protein